MDELILLSDHARVHIYWEKGNTWRKPSESPVAAGYQQVTARWSARRPANGAEGLGAGAGKLNAECETNSLSVNAHV